MVLIAWWSFRPFLSSFLVNQDGYQSLKSPVINCTSYYFRSHFSLSPNTFVSSVGALYKNTNACHSLYSKTSPFIKSFRFSNRDTSTVSSRIDIFSITASPHMQFSVLLTFITLYVCASQAKSVYKFTILSLSFSVSRNISIFSSSNNSLMYPPFYPIPFTFHIAQDSRCAFWWTLVPCSGISDSLPYLYFYPPWVL